MDNKVKLLSSDNEVFEVDVLTVQECETLKTLIELMGTKDAFCLDTVCSKVLAQVIEYCQYHTALHTNSDGNPAIPDNEVRKWNAEFMKMDYQALVDIIQADNFLQIKSLLKLACQAVVDMMVDNSVEEIRQLQDKNIRSLSNKKS